MALVTCVLQICTLVHDIGTAITVGRKRARAPALLGFSNSKREQMVRFRQERRKHSQEGWEAQTLLQSDQRLASI